MMGHHPRSEALFYYFRLEDQIPESHLLRLIDKHVSFEFVRQQLKDSYSDTGRPSIDPELLLRILLVGYLYGITRRTGQRAPQALKRDVIFKDLTARLKSCPTQRPGETESFISLLMSRHLLTQSFLRIGAPVAAFQADED